MSVVEKMVFSLLKSTVKKKIEELYKLRQPLTVERVISDIDETNLATLATAGITKDQIKILVEDTLNEVIKNKFEKGGEENVQYLRSQIQRQERPANQIEGGCSK